MYKLDRGSVIEKIKNIAKWNLREERYIHNMYCDYCNFPKTHFSEHDLKTLIEGKKVVRTTGRCYRKENLEDLSDRDLYELLIMVKQDEVNIMKYNLKDFY